MLDAFRYGKINQPLTHSATRGVALRVSRYQASNQQRAAGLQPTPYASAAIKPQTSRGLLVYSLRPMHQPLSSLKPAEGCWCTAYALRRPRGFTAKEFLKVPRVGLQLSQGTVGNDRSGVHDDDSVGQLE